MTDGPTTDTDAALDRNRSQFGANAANYATSPVHAKGASLHRLVELVEPRPEWVALDIATAAGHVAIALAPSVRSMVASDLTPEMLDVAAGRAAEAGLDNVTTELADAGNLPFADASFDLVTCRIAPHHFADPAAFVTEVARVLRPGGVFGFVDNVVPDDPEVDAFVNDWERRRDPSHVRALSAEAWIELIADAGLELRHQELLAKRMGFTMWADNMSVAEPLRSQLLAELVAASPPVVAYLRPEDLDGDDAAFHLTEAILIAEKRIAETTS